MQLYNLKNDLGEKQDLASAEPERVQQMRQQLHDWYKETDAKFLQAKPGGPEPWRPGK